MKQCMPFVATPRAWAMVPLLAAALSAPAAWAQAPSAAPWVAGLVPDQRPGAAPVQAPLIADLALQQQRLAGITTPWPGQVARIAEQGRWYSPMFRPGMPGRYDLRGLHGQARP